ncbi:hypothetical protein, partial [Haemophilus influenzae]|uniref:hypothetical protein n=1 Tax=Haemophilus influenzae TaxID=727 RepID=UPI001C614D86
SIFLLKISLPDGFLSVFYFLSNKYNIFLDNFFTFSFSLNFLYKNACKIKLAIAYCLCASRGEDNKNTIHNINKEGNSLCQKLLP